MKVKSRVPHRISCNTRRPMLALAILLTLNGCASFPRPLATPQDAALKALESRTIDDAGTEASLDIDAGFGADELFMPSVCASVDALLRVIGQMSQRVIRVTNTPFFGACKA